MNIISNNCCGGWYYRFHKEQFNNPFIWMICPFDSIMQLLTHFYDINWANIKLNESPYRRRTYILTVDNKIDIHYVHYIMSPDYNTPTTLPHKLYPEFDGDTLYNQIWEYIVDTYLRRVKRMIQNKCMPMFILRDEKFASDTSKVTLKDIVNANTEFKRFVITTDKSIQRMDDTCQVYHVRDIEYPKPTIERFKPQIDSFFQIT